MVHIVDTTLRDGEQKAGMAFGIKDKVNIAKLLNKLNIYQVEAGIPIMGGDEKKSIKKIVALDRKYLVSTWNRLNKMDVRASIECSPDIIHISVPASEIQIKTKLGKDRAWVLENVKAIVNYSISNGYRTTIGLEDASRGDFDFNLKISKVAIGEGAERVRYADTVGILYRHRVFNEIKEMVSKLNTGIEMHAHNDFGMAVSSSIKSVIAGAQFIDCTIGGIGERAGNCDYLKFITSAKACLGLFEDIDLQYIYEIQTEILKINEK